MHKCSCVASQKNPQKLEIRTSKIEIRKSKGHGHGLNHASASPSNAARARAGGPSELQRSVWWETSPSELQGSVWCQLGAYVRVHVNLRVHVHLYIGASEVGGGIGLCAIAKALHISVPARTQQHLHAKLMQDSGTPFFCWRDHEKLPIKCGIGCIRTLKRAHARTHA